MDQCHLQRNIQLFAKPKKLTLKKKKKKGNFSLQFCSTYLSQRSVFVLEFNLFKKKIKINP